MVTVTHLVLLPILRTNFYTIHTDSISSTSWADPTDATTQGHYTVQLFRPLKNVVQASLLKISFDATSTSNVAYLTCPELLSQYNDCSGVINPNNDNETFTISDPSTKDSIRNCLTSFNVASSGRTSYEQNDYSTQTQFIQPIGKIDKITTKLLDENGLPLTTASNVFTSYRFTCLKANMGLFTQKINN